MKRPIMTLGLAFLLGLGLAGNGQANSVEEHGASFQRSITVDGQPLELTGTGVARWRIVFTVYAAGLYLPPGTTAETMLDADTARVLEIEYFHNISAEDIIRAANTKLQSQLPAEARARLQPLIDEFHALYNEVNDGDRYRMTYRPGEGTELRFNGKPVGTIAGAEFAAAYFGIWLDADDPLSDNLRRNLLADIEE